jgi:hypothetical protein
VVGGAQREEGREKEERETHIEGGREEAGAGERDRE